MDNPLGPHLEALRTALAAMEAAPEQTGDATELAKKIYQVVLKRVLSRPVRNAAEVEAQHSWLTSQIAQALVAFADSHATTRTEPSKDAEEVAAGVCRCRTCRPEYAALGLCKASDIAQALEAYATTREKAVEAKWRKEWERATSERDAARRTAIALQGADFWAWEDDGDNDLDSMGDGTVVKMTGGTLRALLDTREKAAHAAGVLEAETSFLLQAGPSAEALRNAHAAGVREGAEAEREQIRLLRVALTKAQKLAGQW